MNTPVYKKKKKIEALEKGEKNIVDPAPRQVALMREIARLWLSVLLMILRFMSEMSALQSEDLSCCMPTFRRQEFSHKWRISPQRGQCCETHQVYTNNN